MCTVFIVDDENYVRDELKYLLGSYENITVVGEADNSLDAICKIKELNPELCFFDIHLSDVDGITLAKKAREISPDIKIVFATAYDNYAIQGFELNAVDYILKPFTKERLDKTIERVRENRAAPKAAPPQGGDHNKIVVEKSGIWKLINISDILYIEADNNTVTAHTKAEACSLSNSLKELEHRLRSKLFIRIHKSFIVNMEYIDEVIPWFNYTYKITLKDMGTELPVSRSYVKEFKSLLKIS